MLAAKVSISQGQGLIDGIAGRGSPAVLHALFQSLLRTLGMQVNEAFGSDLGGRCGGLDSRSH